MMDNLGWQQLSHNVQQTLCWYSQVVLHVWAALFTEQWLSCSLWVSMMS